MFLKIHRSCRTVVALCDEEILGKKFEEGKMQLDVRENFYKDRQVNETEAIKILRAQAVEDATFNIVGKESVKTAIKAGIIDENSIIKVGGIPLALVLL